MNASLSLQGPSKEFFPGPENYRYVQPHFVFSCEAEHFTCHSQNLGENLLTDSVHVLYLNLDLHFYLYVG